MMQICKVMGGIILSWKNFFLLAKKLHLEIDELHLHSLDFFNTDLQDCVTMQFKSVILLMSLHFKMGLFTV
jgi:hypothetical protein